MKAGTRAVAGARLPCLVGGAAVPAALKKMGSYYNFQKRTLGDFFRDAGADGLGATLKDRLAWGRMRMSPTDIADITGATYTYLLNGLAPGDNWTGLFEPGERLRLRIINAATQSHFNFRIPDLPMTVVAADGQNVEPVTVAEMQLPVAETWDVIVKPGDRPYTLFAESMDRSGFARGTLSPRPGLAAPVPGLRERPVRTMVEMGMEMPGTAMDEGDAGEKKTMGGMKMPKERPMPGMGVWYGPVVGRHGPDHHAPENSSIPVVLRNRLGEPGVGLADVGHRVLVYTDLRRLEDDFDPRPPDREIELHLTGNMERYIWGFDGKKFSETDHPIEFNHGERLRLVMINDTMMEHPIHLHGMWMELENGHGRKIPRKHTISVKPAGSERTPWTWASWRGCASGSEARAGSPPPRRGPGHRHRRGHGHRHGHGRAQGAGGARFSPPGARGGAGRATGGEGLAQGSQRTRGAETPG